MDATTTRRAFLQTGGALVIGFTLPLAGRAAATSTSMSAYLRIGSDDRITVICGSSEMGQGVLTSIPMLLAEELDADWSKVGVEQAPVDKAYANPLFGMQATGGSTTIRAHWLPMRQAGAAAREMLVAAAAAQWNVGAGQLATDKGFYESMQQLLALEKTIPMVSICKKGRRTPAEEARESSEAFKEGQRFRAGCEGSISVLKRAFNLGKCFFKGFKNYAASVGCAVFCHNLVLLTRL